MDSLEIDLMEMGYLKVFGTAQEIDEYYDAVGQRDYVLHKLAGEDWETLLAFPLSSSLALSPRLPSLSLLRSLPLTLPLW